MNRNPPKEATFLSDFDGDEPYAGVDLERFPEWWRRNVETFERHEMRPYRPPRFTDGVLTEAVRRSLAAEFDVEIRLRATNAGETAEWEIWVDDRTVGTIERWRDGRGYSVFGTDSETFRRVVSSAATEHRTGSASR